MAILRGIAMASHRTAERKWYCILRESMRKKDRAKVPSERLQLSREIFAAVKSYSVILGLLSSGFVLFRVYSHFRDIGFSKVIEPFVLAYDKWLGQPFNSLLNFPLIQLQLSVPTWASDIFLWNIIVCSILMRRDFQLGPIFKTREQFNAFLFSSILMFSEKFPGRIRLIFAHVITVAGFIMYLVFQLVRIALVWPFVLFKRITTPHIFKRSSKIIPDNKIVFKKSATFDEDVFATEEYVGNYRVIALAHFVGSLFVGVSWFIFDYYAGQLGI